MSRKREPHPGMTKQGGRDLNHVVPKAGPLAAEPTGPLVEELVVAVTEAAMTPIES